jgi:hypothetical protein
MTAWIGDIIVDLLLTAEGDGDCGRRFPRGNGEPLVLPAKRLLFLALGVGVNSELEPLSGVKSAAAGFCGGVWGVGIVEQGGEDECGDDDGPVGVCDQKNMSLEIPEVAKTGQLLPAAAGGLDLDASDGWGHVCFAFNSALDSCFGLL